MTITAYTIDDEEHALNVLHNYIDKTPGMSLIGSATDPLIALEKLSKIHSPTVLFIDIDMPELNGIELASALKSSGFIVFTTSFREYGPEAYTLSAADYLLKPISYERFLSCVQRIRTSLKSKAESNGSDPHLFVKTGNKGRLQKIIFRDIIFIEAAQNYMHIVFANEKVVTYTSVTEILDRLPEQDFVRVHKSFIINISHIKSFEKTILTMTNGSSVPVGRIFRQAFFEKVPAIRDID